MAGVAQHSNYLEDPMGRLRRTARYVSTVTFGTHAEAEAAAQIVRGVHKHVHGTDPVTGRRYSASDPATMVWVHCVEVHSFLAAYRAYARPLSRADQDRYLAEQVEAAVLLGTPRARVPDSVDAYRDYFASVRHELCTSPEAEAAIGFVRRPSLPDLPPAERAAAPAGVPRHGRRSHVAGAALAARAGRAARARAARAAQPGGGDHGVERRGRGAAHPGTALRLVQVPDPTLGTKRRPRVPAAA